MTKINKLPFDKLGSRLSNLINGEYHNLKLQRGMKYRVVTLSIGYFFVESVVITDNYGYTLKSTDYTCTYLHEELTDQLGKEVAALIVIYNPQVGDEVYITAQMVGGAYCTHSEAVVQAYNQLSVSRRAPYWRDIKDKPNEVEVAGHMHAAWELYKFEELVDVINGVTTQVLQNSAKKYNEINEDNEEEFNRLDIEFNSLHTRLAQHISTANPHHLTAVQISLSNLENYSRIALEDSLVRGYASLSDYTTPLSTRNMIDVNFLVDLQSHVTNSQDPHFLTPQQVDAFPISVSDQYLAGKQDSNATVTSTMRVENKTYSEIREYLLSTIPAANVTSGTVPIDRIRNNVAGSNSNYVVVGNNNQRDFGSVINGMIPVQPSLIWGRISVHKKEWNYQKGYNLLIDGAVKAFNGGWSSNVEDWYQRDWLNTNLYPVGSVAFLQMKVHGAYPASAIFLRTATGWVHV